QPTMPPRRTWLWFLGVLAVNFLLAKFLMPGAEGPLPGPFTLFKEQVTKGNVQAIHSRADVITGKFKSPGTSPPPSEKAPAAGGSPPATRERSATPPSAPKEVTSFTTTLPSFVDRGLEAFLITHGVEISAKPIGEPEGSWTTFLFGFGPTLLFIGFYIWFFRRAAKQGGGLGGGFMGFGKSKARRYDQEKDTRITFDDVAGINSSENELVEIVEDRKSVG